MILVIASPISASIYTSYGHRVSIDTRRQDMVTYLQLYILWRESFMIGQSRSTSSLTHLCTVFFLLSGCWMLVNAEIQIWIYYNKDHLNGQLTTSSSATSPTIIHAFCIGLLWSAFVLVCAHIWFNLSPFSRIFVTLLLGYTFRLKKNGCSIVVL